MESIRVKRLKSRTSPLWRVFKRLDPGYALCRICGSKFSYKSSNSNLKRHLLSKHQAAFEMTLKQGLIKPHEVAAIPLEKFIPLVKNHPCLWDHRSELYRDAVAQQKAWEVIACLLFPRKDQSVVVTALNKEFSALRKAYFSTRRCQYSRELSFLAVLLDDIKPKIEEIVEKCEEEEMDTLDLLDSNNYEGSTSENESLPNEPCNTNGTTDTELPPNNEEQIYQDSGQNMCTHNELKPQTFFRMVASPSKFNLEFNNANEDHLFLLSLLEEIKTVPDEFKLSFKAELMHEFEKLLKKI